MAERMMQPLRQIFAISGMGSDQSNSVEARANAVEALRT